MISYATTGTEDLPNKEGVLEPVTMAQYELRTGYTTVDPTTWAPGFFNSTASCFFKGSVVYPQGSERNECGKPRPHGANASATTAGAATAPATTAAAAGGCTCPTCPGGSKNGGQGGEDVAGDSNGVELGTLVSAAHLRRLWHCPRAGAVGSLCSVPALRVAWGAPQLWASALPTNARPNTSAIGVSAACACLSPPRERSNVCVAPSSRPAGARRLHRRWPRGGVRRHHVRRTQPPPYTSAACVRTRALSPRRALRTGVASALCVWPPCLVAAV